MNITLDSVKSYHLPVRLSINKAGAIKWGGAKLSGTQKPRVQNGQGRLEVEFFGLQLGFFPG